MEGAALSCARHRDPHRRRSRVSRQVCSEEPLQQRLVHRDAHGSPSPILRRCLSAAAARTLLPTVLLGYYSRPSVRLARRSHATLVLCNSGILTYTPLAQNTIFIFLQFRFWAWFLSTFFLFWQILGEVCSLHPPHIISKHKILHSTAESLNTDFVPRTSSASSSSSKCPLHFQTQNPSQTLFTELYCHLQSVTTHHLKTQNPSLTLLTDLNHHHHHHQSVAWLLFNKEWLIELIPTTNKLFLLLHTLCIKLRTRVDMYEIVATVLNWCIWHE